MTSLSFFLDNVVMTAPKRRILSFVFTVLYLYFCLYNLFLLLLLSILFFFNLLHFTSQPTYWVAHRWPMPWASPWALAQVLFTSI